jgi:iron complex outermembrane receptor protein
MKWRLLASTVCLAAPAFTGAASAQEVLEDVTAQEAPTIIVTAQKREENIQEVPIAITAVDNRFIESRNIQSIDDLGSLAPNVKIEQAPSSGTISQIAIRGSVTINPAITWEPAVGLYLDGVYIAKAQGSIFDVADLERVEVLRGPQGTLYGRNTLAGAVNLITRKPSGEFGGKFEAGYGNYDHWRAQGVLDLPAVGPFSAKISGQIEKRDGFVDVVGNPDVDDVNDLDGKSLMAQLRFEPTNWLTLDYVYDYNDYDQRPRASQLLSVTEGGFFDPANPAALVPLGLFADEERQDTLALDGAPLFEKSRTYGHALTVTADLGELELKSITAYRDLRWSDSTDLDGSPFDIALTQRFTDMDSFSQELQLTGTVLDDRLNFVVGAFYYEEDAGTVNPQRFFGLFGPFGNEFDSRYAQKTDAWAVYGQADIEVIDTLTLTLGARYTEETKEISRFLQVLTDPNIPAAALPLTVADVDFGDLPDADFDNFSPSATLSWQATPDGNLYARYAKGYKSGGFNGETNNFVAPTADCPTGTPELCNPYLPEEVDSYELGVKSVLLDGSLVLNLAGFYNKHEDIQLSVFRATGAASSEVINAAKATIKGIELEAAMRPAPWLTVNASLAILDAEYDSFIEGGQEVSDNRAFPHTPDYTAGLGFDWRVVEGDWGRFNLVGDLSWVSEYYTFPYAIEPPSPSGQLATDSESSGRVIVNLSANVAEIPLGFGEAKLRAWVRNLTNEDDPSNFIDFGAGFGGLLLGYFPDPRIYGATVGFSF